MIDLLHNCYPIRTPVTVAELRAGDLLQVADRLYLIVREEDGRLRAAVFCEGTLCDPQSLAGRPLMRLSNTALVFRPPYPDD